MLQFCDMCNKEECYALRFPTYHACHALGSTAAAHAAAKGATELFENVHGVSSTAKAAEPTSGSTKATARVSLLVSDVGMRRRRRTRWTLEGGEGRAIVCASDNVKEKRQRCSPVAVCASDTVKEKRRRHRLDVRL